MIFTVSSNVSVNETIKKCRPGDIVFLRKGIYNEKIEINVDGIKIIGEDFLETKITNHDFFHKIMSDYNECNTFRTYTCYVGGNDVIIENLTIENSSVPSSRYGQAVALHVDGDNFICSNVNLVSAQDTLFTGPLPPDLIIRHQGFLKECQLTGNPSKQYYKNCTIKGDVDFIFGCATALFENCKIISIARASSSVDGYICAPAHNIETELGYLFLNCDLIAEEGIKNVYLARPWRDYGSAIFINCKMDKHINPEGFDKWGNSSRDKTARFFEYSPSYDTSKRVSWIKSLSYDEANEIIEKYNSIFKCPKKCRKF